MYQDELKADRLNVALQEHLVVLHEQLRLIEQAIEQSPQIRPGWFIVSCLETAGQALRNAVNAVKED